MVDVIERRGEVVTADVTIIKIVPAEASAKLAGVELIDEQNRNRKILRIIEVLSRGGAAIDKKDTETPAVLSSALDIIEQARQGNFDSRSPYIDICLGRRIMAAADSPQALETCLSGYKTEIELSLQARRTPSGDSLTPILEFFAKLYERRSKEFEAQGKPFGI